MKFNYYNKALHNDTRLLAITFNIFEVNKNIISIYWKHYRVNFILLFGITLYSINIFAK